MHLRRRPSHRLDYPSRWLRLFVIMCRENIVSVVAKHIATPIYNQLQCIRLCISSYINNRPRNPDYICVDN